MRSTLRVCSTLLLGMLAVAGCRGGGGDGSKNEGKGNPGASASQSNASLAESTGIHAPRISDSPGGSSQTICQDTDIAACATGGALSDSCLTLYLACGRYLDIMAYERTLQGYGTNDWYYVGVAYHGLFVRNRAAAARCQFGSAARSALQSYLHAAADDTTNLNDQRTFQQVYQATKLLASVRDIPGCPNDGIGVTYDELYGATLAHGRDVVEGLFLGDPPPGVADEVNQAKANMQAAIRGFISDAATIETQLGLLKTAMDQSNTRLSETEVAFQAFGATVTEAADSTPGKPHIATVVLPTTSVFAGQQATYHALAQHAVGFQATLVAAMGGASISDYEKARDTLVGYARDATSASAVLANRMTSPAALDLDGAQKAVRDDIQAKTAVLRSTDDGSGAYIALKAKWKAYGIKIGTCSLSPAPWYCK